MSLIYFEILLFIFIIYVQHRKNKQLVLKQLIKSKSKRGKSEMKELAKKFIDKECLIYTFNSQLIGTIKDVTDGAILLINNQNETEAINIEFIVRIREYPRKKNGKKKSIVTD